jgi:hypothetical protein
LTSDRGGVGVVNSANLNRLRGEIRCIRSDNSGYFINAAD